jgi:hypothetical protein
LILTNGSPPVFSLETAGRAGVDLPLRYLASGKPLNQVQDLLILIGASDNLGVDQLFPIYSEQPFPLDECEKTKEKKPMF